MEEDREMHEAEQGRSNQQTLQLSRLSDFSSHHEAKKVPSAEEQIQQALEFKARREELCDIPRFRDLASKIFPPRPEVEALLQEIHTVKIPYLTMWPSSFSEEAIKMAEEIRAPVSTTLNMVIRIPKVLLEVEERRRVKVWLYLHGGGGFTGSPTFPPWEFKAGLQYQLQEQNVVWMGPDYPKLFETDGAEALRNNTSILQFTFTRLQSILSDLNSNLEVAWEDYNISSMSFGGGLALDMAFLTLPSYPERPLGFEVKKLIFRSFLGEKYEREHSDFMDVPVSREEAETHSQNMMRLRRLGYAMPVVASVDPPYRMFMAYATSVSRGEGAWDKFWDYASPYDLVKQDGTCPWPNLRVDFVHGGGDVMVKLEVVRNQVESLRRKFPHANINLGIRPGEGHAADCDEEFSYYAEFFAS